MYQQSNLIRGIQADITWEVLSEGMTRLGEEVNQTFTQTKRTNNAPIFGANPMDGNHALDLIRELDEATHRLKENPPEPEPFSNNPRSTLYHCTEHLLYALLAEAGDSEKQALYRAIEHLGIAQIRWLNASAADLDGPGADVLPPTDTHQIEGDSSHHAKP